MNKLEKMLEDYCNGNGSYPALYQLRDASNTINALTATIQWQVGEIATLTAECEKLAEVRNAAGSDAVTLADALNTVLWLERRLPKGYDEVPHVQRTKTSLRAALDSRAPVAQPLAPSGGVLPVAEVVAGNMANRLQWVSDGAHSETPVGTKLYAQPLAASAVLEVIAKNAQKDDFTCSTPIGYAQFLAWAIWRDHYKAASPDFTIMADLCGVLSQIDNMVCGMTLAAAPRQEAQPAVQGHPAVTPMFLLNAAMCIESPHEVATSRKREVLASLHRVADELQEARMASKFAAPSQQPAASPTPKPVTFDQWLDSTEPKGWVGDRAVNGQLYSDMRLVWNACLAAQVANKPSAAQTNDTKGA